MINLQAQQMQNLQQIFDGFLTAQINTSALVRNLNRLRNKCPNARVCAAVKANAYGHGIDIVAPALDAAGVEMMAVSNFTEALELIEIGINADIFILGSQLSIYKGTEKQKIADWIVENDIRITPMIPEDIEALENSARRTGKKALVHLKLDTGMSRMGLCSERLKLLTEQIINSEFIEIEGLYTHLATADTEDKSFTNKQLSLLNEFVGHLAQNGVTDIFVHTCNSAKTLANGNGIETMIRPGLGLYGYFAGPFNIDRPEIEPIMKIVSKITAVKSIKKGRSVGYGCSYKAENDMVIALVPIGYGDGYDRKLSNTGSMKIASQYAPIVGRVSMDQTIIDVTDLLANGLDIKPGINVVIIDDDANSQNSVENIANLLNTIPYEITTRLGERIKRVAIDD